MIQLPIEIGDVILTGRFKNKKVTVKEIGTDEYGLPTVNGRGIMKIRIQKLMTPKKEKQVESRLTSLIRKLVLEERQRLIELDISDEQLSAEIEEYANLADEMDRLKAQLKQLEKRFSELDAKFIKMLEALETELGHTRETFIRAKNILITIKKRGKTDATKYQYKEAFEWLYTRVSPQMKKLIDEAMEASKTVYQIKSSLGVQRESRLNENWLTDLYGKVKTWFSRIIGKLRNTNQKANSALDKIEGMI